MVGEPSVDLISMAQVSARTGLTARQIRHWERRGILSPRRSSGNQRRYAETDVATLLYAKRMREVGFSVAEVTWLVRFPSSSVFGVEVEAVVRIVAAVGAARVRLDVAEQVLEVLRGRLVRRGGSLPVAPTAPLSTTYGGNRGVAWRADLLGRPGPSR